MKTAAERAALIDRYADGPRLIREALATVPPEALKWRPAEGKWSAHEVVCHCADSEANGALRIRFLLASENPTINAYDQEAWAVALDYHALPLEPALATVEAVRANTVPLLRTLPEEAWERWGTHPESGRYTAERWLEIYAAHLEGHARQIARNVAAFKGR